MAYKVIILYRLYMPSYFLGTFTEYPYIFWLLDSHSVRKGCCFYISKQHRNNKKLKITY